MRNWNFCITPRARRSFSREDLKLTHMEIVSEGKSRGEKVKQNKWIERETKETSPVKSHKTDWWLPWRTVSQVCACVYPCFSACSWTFDVFGWESSTANVIEGWTSTMMRISYFFFHHPVLCVSAEILQQCCCYTIVSGRSITLCDIESKLEKVQTSRLTKRVLERRKNHTKWRRELL